MAATRENDVVEEIERDCTQIELISEKTRQIREFNRVTAQILNNFNNQAADFPTLMKIWKNGASKKNFFTVGRSQQRRLRIQIKSAIAETTQFLKSMGLCLSLVEINPIELDECDYKLKISTPTSLADLDLRRPNKNNLLFFKDKHSVKIKYNNNNNKKKEHI